MSRPKLPAPPPPPPNPAIAEEAARVKRVNAEREAIAEAKAGGRRSTIHAGDEMAMAEQHGRGLLASEKRRRVSEEMEL